MTFRGTLRPEEVVDRFKAFAVTDPGVTWPTNQPPQVFLDAPGHGVDVGLEHAPSLRPIRRLPRRSGSNLPCRDQRAELPAGTVDEGAGVELVELACWDRVAGVD